MPTTRVVNMKNSQCDVYIGRPGHLGNPFKISKKLSRDDVLILFEDYARKRMAADPAYAALVRSLKGKRLGCWCKPQPCHGDVLAKLAEETDGDPDTDGKDIRERCY